MEVLLVSIIVVLYFVPSAVAFVRNTKHGTGVMLLNLFLGWTFIFWVIALVWAVSDSREKAESISIKF